MKAQSESEKFKVAVKGICSSFACERHLKVHGVLASIALIACLLLRVDWVGWCLVVICIGAVIAAELFNTALETLCDKVCTQQDPLIAKVKDISAGCVLVLAVMSVVVGLIVFATAGMRLI